MVEELIVRTRAEPGRNAVDVLPGGHLFIETDAPIDTSLTPWVPLLTPIAMRRGARLRFDGPVATDALPASRAAQAILAEWHANLTEVDVEATWVDPAPRGTGVGLFFSGGVDSFYSALDHSSEVTHLIFVTGFDIGLRKDWLDERARAAVGEIAEELGVELLTARTNLRRLSNRWCSWGKQYHGAALAGIAHLFSPVIGTAIIPSSHAHPWGSDPELDPLWSSTVRIVHDRPASRLAKTARVADSDLAMRHLRVCYCTHPGEYNCGRCEKCLRTMIALYSVGALERSHTFPHTVSPRAIARLEIKAGGIVFARENLAKLRAMPVRNRPVEWALALALALAPLRGGLRTWRRSLRRSLQAIRRWTGRVRRGLGRRLRPGQSAAPV
ncbi:hypothetical protein PROP_00413 [Propionicimonas sp. T2.31MG-18]|uniref:hypothetical protein n=1 Tax=Propionicimonas sp. T2.31MG-18 TaxID=3157620 RepID=UPI0035E86E65